MHEAGASSLEIGVFNVIEWVGYRLPHRHLPGCQHPEHWMR
jgi:hypothetical protein